MCSRNQTGFLGLGLDYISAAKVAAERVISAGCRFEECAPIFQHIRDNQVSESGSA
eukprot:COSAG01_NODE_5078_length_4502_cov_6.740177_4_plen_56_part_00